MAFLSKFTDNSDIFASEEIFNIAEGIGNKFFSEIETVNFVSTPSETGKIDSDRQKYKDICNKCYVLSKLIMYYCGSEILAKGSNNEVSSKMDHCEAVFDNKDGFEIRQKFGSRVPSLKGADKNKIINFLKAAIPFISNDRNINVRFQTSGGIPRKGFSGLGEYSEHLDRIFEYCEKEINELYPNKVIAMNIAKNISLN